MDTSKIKSERISVCAKGRVIENFFPGKTIDEILVDDNLSERAMDMHSGALCLYGATLLTKVYEIAPEKIESEHGERLEGLISLMKASSKFAGKTEDEIKTSAKEMINKDIRNSFAHGNFEVSYDIYSKKLYYVLKPRRKDFVVDKPIIISKNALFKVNREYVSGYGTRFYSLNKAEIERHMVQNFNEKLKDFILPVEMLKLSEYYLEKPERFAKPYKPREISYSYIQFILSIARITYEQDDYYNLFGKDSKIFSKIALMRNATAHNSFKFDKNVSAVSFDDRKVGMDEELGKVVSRLIVANIQKDMIMENIKKGEKNEDTIKGLAELLDKCYDTIFSNFEEFIKLDEEDFIE